MALYVVLVGEEGENLSRFQAQPCIVQSHHDKGRHAILPGELRLSCSLHPSIAIHRHLDNWKCGVAPYVIACHRPNNILQVFPIVLAGGIFIVLCARWTMRVRMVDRMKFFAKGTHNTIRQLAFEAAGIYNDLISRELVFQVVNIYFNSMLQRLWSQAAGSQRYVELILVENFVEVMMIPPLFPV